MTDLQQISLRGTLADEFYRLNRNAREVSLQDFIRNHKTDLLCIPSGTMILVGKKSERGEFRPDW